MTTQLLLIIIIIIKCVSEGMMRSREQKEKRMKRTNTIENKSLSTFSPSHSEMILHEGGLRDD